MDIPTDLLQPVVAVARSVLSRLDSEEVPAALQRVRQATGRELPPPFARRLISELDGNEWLRDRVADESAFSGSEKESEASRLFVTRPEGWEERVSEIASSWRNERDVHRLPQLEAQLASLEKKLEVSRRKEAKFRKEATEARRDLETARRADRAETTSGLAAFNAELDRVRRELAEVGQERDRLDSDLTGANHRLATTRSELLKARRTATSAGERVDREASPSSRLWATGDGLALARHLDSVVQRAATSTGEHEPAPVPPPPLKLPPGIRPDRREAVEWLISRNSPATLVVDGYNATHHLVAKDPTGAAAREMLVHLLRRLRRQATALLTVVVVFDSTLGGVEPTPAEEVDVRFAEVADDEVNRLASDLVGDVAVVSSDREVREGAESSGALVIWSEALAGWRSR